MEARARDAARRAVKLRTLRVDVPETSSLPADEADEALARVEAGLKRAEALKEAHEAATRPLRDPAVSAWTRESRRRLQREADAALAAQDAAALDEARRRAEALRAEAARASEEAARARRRGHKPPERERRAGDTLDGYG